MMDTSMESMAERLQKSNIINSRIQNNRNASHFLGHQSMNDLLTSAASPDNNFHLKNENAALYNSIAKLEAQLAESLEQIE
jgi:hypothetical protein